jgi:hypothetical protein
MGMKLDLDKLVIIVYNALVKMDTPTLTTPGLTAPHPRPLSATRSIRNRPYLPENTPHPKTLSATKSASYPSSAPNSRLFIILSISNRQFFYPAAASCAPFASHQSPLTSRAPAFLIDTSTIRNALIPCVCTAGTRSNRQKLKICPTPFANIKRTYAKVRRTFSASPTFALPLATLSAYNRSPHHLPARLIPGTFNPLGAC